MNASACFSNERFLNVDKINIYSQIWTNICKKNRILSEEQTDAIFLPLPEHLFCH